MYPGLGKTKVRGVFTNHLKRPHGRPTGHAKKFPSSYWQYHKKYAYADAKLDGTAIRRI